MSAALPGLDTLTADQRVRFHRIGAVAAHDMTLGTLAPHHRHWYVDTLARIKRSRPVPFPHIPDNAGRAA